MNYLVTEIELAISGVAETVIRLLEALLAIAYTVTFQLVY
jgi:hypothetical protein